MTFEKHLPKKKSTKKKKKKKKKNYPNKVGLYSQTR